jgi:hypothetical protein
MSKPDRVYSNRLSFVPPLATGNAVQIQVPNELEIHANNTQFVGGVDLGPRAKFVEFDDYSGNRLMFTDPAVARRIEYDPAITVDFNSCTVLGLSGVSGGSVDAQAVASNNSNPSSGSAYGTVDAELDDLQTRVSANTTRTTGLTASKILVSSASGVLGTGSFDATDIVRKSVSTGQTLSGPLTVGGNLNISDGSAYQVNGVALSSSNLTDSATLSKLDANETHSGNKTFTGQVSITNANDVIMNKAATIQQFDVAGGAFVGDSNVEYTTQQGCIKKTDEVVLTDSKYTTNASDQTGKTNAHGFLRVSNGTTGEVVNTGEVVMADSAITQTINGNKTFSSSVTVGSSGTNAFISSGGYVMLTTPSGVNGEIKFNKAGSVHTMTMSDLGNELDNLTFDANFNLTSGNHFKIDQHQIQVSDLYDGAQVQKENSNAMKLTDAVYTANAVDASGKSGGHGFLQAIEETTGLIANTAEVVRADGAVTQSIDGSKTFVNSVTVGDLSASNYSIVSAAGIISLRNASEGAGFHLGASGAVRVLENSSSNGINVNGNISIPTGSNYQINDQQISSINLSDNGVLVKNDQSNTFSAGQTFNNNAIFGFTDANASQATFGESGSTQFTLGKTTATSNSLDLHTNNTSADISVTFGTGEGLTIPMRITDDTVEISSSTDTETSLRYKTSSYAGSADTSIPNEVVTRADVNAFLTSAATSNSVKLLIVEGGGGTGFDGSSTSLTINHLNPVIIRETRHIPDGSGSWVVHPAYTDNTFQVQCLCQCEKGLTVSNAAVNYLARGSVAGGEAINDVQVVINQLLARSPQSWVPDFLNVGINGSGATVEMTAGLAISLQPTLIRTRYGTDGSGNAVYKIEARGRIQKSSGNFTTATILFQAPVGWRASIEHNFVTQAHTGAVQARIDVATNGNVTLITDGSDTASFVNLSTLSYFTI